MTWEQADVPLVTGDRVVLYTDGVTEAMNDEDEMYGEERFYQLVDRLPADLSAAAMVDEVVKDLREFLGELEPGDDVTVMALRVLEGAGPDGATRA